MVTPMLTKRPTNARQFFFTPHTVRRAQQGFASFQVRLCFNSWYRSYRRTHPVFLSNWVPIGGSDVAGTPFLAAVAVQGTLYTTVS